MEFDLEPGGPSTFDGRSYYFFAVELELPAEPYGALLFESDTFDHHRGYRIDIYDEHRQLSKVPCMDFGSQSVRIWERGLGHIQHLCASPLLTPDELQELTRIRYLRMTLVGEYRLLWVKSIRVLWRALTEVPPNVPPPPLPPPVANPSTPPESPPPPPVTCATYPGVTYDPSLLVLLAVEPCGLSASACCAHLRDNNGALFELTSSGCCTLLNPADAAAAAVIAAGPPTESMFGVTTGM